VLLRRPSIAFISLCPYLFTTSSILLSSIILRTFVIRKLIRWNLTTLLFLQLTSGRWAASPGPALSEADSWSSLRDLRTNNSGLSRTVSISSKQSDTERHVRFAEPAYSFVGMHCIFDSCKTSVTILKFGRASSDLLAYGAADGSLTVCQVSEPPSVLQKLIGHSKNITG